jgi:hypothetical protein
MPVENHRPTVAGQDCQRYSNPLLKTKLAMNECDQNISASEWTKEFKDSLYEQTTANEGMNGQRWTNQGDKRAKRE